MKKCFFCHESDFREVGFARLPVVDSALGRNLRRIAATILLIGVYLTFTGFA
jgi:hypothetical protein